MVFSGSGCHGSPVFSTSLLLSGAPYSFAVQGQPAGQYSASDFTGAGCVNFTISNVNNPLGMAEHKTQL